MNRTPTLRLLTTAVLAAVVGACSGDSPTPTDLSERMPDARTFAAPSGLTLPTGTESWLYVCKLANDLLPANGGIDDGTAGKTFYFDVSAGGGTIVPEASDPAGIPIVAYGTSVALSDDCWLVWAGDEDEEVTVTERLDPTIELVSTQLETSAFNSGPDDTDRLTPGGPGEYVVTPLAGFNIVYFKNRTIEVEDEGCTLTIGYWKTHSEYGPAPYDDNWANLASGADTPFFLSGQSWYEVFGTPVRGNQYYNLAHQYMGAKLNTLNGASVPGEVADAIAAAEALFALYTPAQIAGLRGNNPLRAQFVALAGTLGAYNEGDIGPGHCD